MGVSLQVRIIYEKKKHKFPLEQHMTHATGNFGFIFFSFLIG